MLNNAWLIDIVNQFPVLDALSNARHLHSTKAWVFRHSFYREAVTFEVITHLSGGPWESSLREGFVLVAYWLTRVRSFHSIFFNFQRFCLQMHMPTWQDHFREIQMRSNSDGLKISSLAPGHFIAAVISTHFTFGLLSNFQESFHRER